MKASYQNSMESAEESRVVELDVGYAETARLLEQLLVPNSSLHVEASEGCLLDFYVEGDSSLWVEVADVEHRFWSISEIDLVAGKEILSVASEGGAFSDSTPESNREWDAHSRY